MRVRFAGGPLHGQVKDLETHNSLSYVTQEIPDQHYTPDHYTGEPFPPIKRWVYRFFTFSWGDLAAEGAEKIERVMCPDYFSLSESEKWIMMLPPNGYGSTSDMAKAIHHANRGRLAGWQRERVMAAREEALINVIVKLGGTP